MVTSEERRSALKLTAQQEIDIEDIVQRTVVATLDKMGIDPTDHKELRADFDHLRKWRKSVEQASGYTFKLVFTTIIAGGLGALWLGFQAMLHK